MKISVVCVGKLKETYWRDAISEYKKRIEGYAKVEIIEVNDLPTPEKASQAVIEDIKSKEGRMILSKIKPGDFVIALDLNQKEYTSEEFSASLEKWLVRGGSEASFLIGGSLGLSDECKKRADVSVSFGKLTYPHQLARVMLLEQLYRAFRIAHHEPYHK
jgi:23S rRNA (pseudouridine1915-N3)-methyltransferase